MLTTKLFSFWDLFIYTKLYTHVPKFYVVLPKLFRMGIFFDCTMSQLMDEYMEDVVDTPI